MSYPQGVQVVKRHKLSNSKAKAERALKLDLNNEVTPRNLRMI